MKRVIALLLCVVLMLPMLAACNDSTAEEAHVHTYAETWTSDAVGHWYVSTCGCADAKINKLAHTDANNDGACDICTYTNHIHTYSEEWTADCTNHWNAADCGHIVAGTNLAAHVDENADGKCDVCAWMIEDIHNHYYATEWSNDAEYHWHAALCEHGVEVADKAAHELNAAGYCTVCEAKINEIDMTDLAAVLAAAMAQNGKVAYGDVIATESVYGGTGAQTLENGKTNRVHFALGNGQSYVQYISFDMNGNYLGQEEQWFEDLGNDEVFGAAMLAGEYELSPIAGAAQFLNGYNYIPGSIIPSDSADTSTLANMLAALYNQMKAGERVSNALEAVEDGVYTFSYTYYSVNPATYQGAVFSVEIEYYNVDVAFTVNEDLIIDTADFQVEVYRDYEADSDLTYEYVDNGDGTVTISNLALKATANPSFYTYTVAQTSGERTFTTPYPRASLIPSSVELLYVLETAWNDDYTQQVVVDSETIGDTYEILVGTYAKFAIGDVLPVTASSKFLNSSDFTYSFVNNDPESDAVCWDVNDTVLNGYSAYSGMLKLKLLNVGEYTVTIGMGEAKKVFTLKIVPEAEIELPADTATTVNVATTDTYGFFDTYSYTAAAAGNYTFNFPAGLGLEVDGNVVFDFYENTNGRSYSKTLAAGETFTFTVGAVTKGAWVINVDIPGADSGDEGGEDSGDEGSNDYNTMIVAGPNTLYFSSAEITADAASRPLTITAAGNYKFASGNLFVASIVAADGTEMTKNADYTYTLEAGEYTVNFGRLSMFGVAADAACTLNVEASTPAGGDDGGDVGGGDDIVPETDPLKEAVLGWYTLNDREVILYQNYSTGDYVANIYGEGYDLYFTFEVTDNGDGSYTLALTYLPNPDMEVGLDEKDAILAETFVVTPEGDDVGGGDEPALGTTENPESIFAGEPVTLDYVGGGYDLYWYGFYAMTGGYLTITTTYENVLIRIGSDPNMALSNIDAGTGTTLKVYVGAGEFVYVGIGDLDFASATIAFNVTFTPFFSDALDSVVGTWTGEYDWYGSITNMTLVINADGSGTYTVSGWSLDEYTLAYVVLDGNALIIKYENEWTAAVMTGTLEGDTLTIADNGKMIALTQGGSSEGGDEGGEEGGDDNQGGTAGSGSGTERDPYIVTTLPSELTFDSAHDVYYTWNVQEDATIVISYCANAYVSIIGCAWDKDGAALTYTLTVEAGDVVSINPWATNPAGPYTYTVTVVTPDEGGNEGGENSGNEGGSDEGGADVSEATAIKLVGNGHYASNTVSGGNLALAASAAEATVYYLESAGEGLYHIFFLNGDVKTYLNCGISNSSISTTTVAAEATNWSLDETNNHIVVDGVTDWSGQNRVLVYDFTAGTYVFRSKTTGNINNTSCYAVWYETV